MSLMRKFSWYVVGQLIAYAFDLGVFLLLFHFVGFSPVLSNVCSKVCAATFAFFFHATVSFRGHATNRIVRSLVLYALVVAGNTVGTSSILWAATTFLHTPETPTKIAADMLGVFLTFALVGNVVFPKQKAV